MAEIEISRVRTKPKAYLAGPMRGYEDFNFPAFDRAQAHLESLGYIVINPAQVDRVMEGWGKKPPEDLRVTRDLRRRVIRRDINEILEFDPDNEDIIYFLRGWQNSAGVQVERALGEFLGLTFKYEKYAEPYPAEMTVEEYVYGGRPASGQKCDACAEAGVQVKML